MSEASTGDELGAHGAKNITVMKRLGGLTVLSGAHLIYIACVYIYIACVYSKA